MSSRYPRFSFYSKVGWKCFQSDHRIKQDLLQQASGILEAVSEIKDAASLPLDTESPYISGIRLDHIEMNTGRVAVRIEFMSPTIMRCSVR